MALSEAFPTQFHVAVVTAREKVSGHRWLKERWQVIGVTAMTGAQVRERRQIVSNAQGEQYLWTGFTVLLHKDEMESYYYNLRAEQPQIYVISRPGSEDGSSHEPVPFLVTLSYDAGAGYLEDAEADVQAVSIPPALYRWMEQYVLEYYTPTQRKKRKRQNWREEP